MKPTNVKEAARLWGTRLFYAILQVLIAFIVWLYTKDTQWVKYLSYAFLGHELGTLFITIGAILHVRQELKDESN